MTNSFIKTDLYFSIFSSTLPLPALSLTTPFSVSSNTPGDIPRLISTSVPKELNLILLSSSPLILFGSVDKVAHFFLISTLTYKIFEK